MAATENAEQLVRVGTGRLLPDLKQTFTNGSHLYATAIGQKWAVADQQLQLGKFAIRVQTYLNAPKCC